MRCLHPIVASCLIAHIYCASSAATAEVELSDSVRSTIADRCAACHADGAEEGGLDLDKLVAGGYGKETTQKWVAIWKNVRAETMPPPDGESLAPQQRGEFIKWIESDVFRLDPDNIDPGVVTIRRMNREEYRRSIFELFQIEYNVDEEFPADDTGYGFDTIGDVLNMSPVLFEKYLAAADAITKKAVPLDGPSPPEIGFWGDHWKGSAKPEKLPFDKSNIVRVTKRVAQSGTYQIRMNYRLDNRWSRLSETALLTLRAVYKDGQRKELARHEAGWMNRDQPWLEGELKLPKGEFTLELEVMPLMPPESKGGDEKNRSYSIAIAETKLVGPLEGERHYKYPAKITFFDGPPSKDPTERESYAREIIRRRADLAFRRPVDERTIERLTAVAVEEMNRPGRRFEHGIKAALALVISSPRFLFRAEGQSQPDNPAEIVQLDEFDLASRMAFMLWSSIPDQTLHGKAKEGRLRAELDETIDWMLSQRERSERFSQNFVGQWLQIRDIHNVDPNAKYILGRKHPLLETAERSGWHVREAMRRETESLFRYLVDESRPIEELLTARYTFVNKYTAKVYGLEGVNSRDMTRVDLPPATHRRGILTHGSVLLVTSNPTRTSPVKRGLFVLENLLGTPAPPAPADVPPLEEVKSVDIRTASLRTILEAHRESPECASCHQRMDPLGLALEHFDALGFYRDVERAREGWRDNKPVPEKPIDVTGRLLTGEEFQSLDELIDILATSRKRDLYRCVTEKLLTYALGRGIEYTDSPTIENIIDRVEADGGSMRTLVKEVIKSKPFQYRRGAGQPVVSTRAG